MIDKVENLEKQLNSIKDKQAVENAKYQMFINFLGLSGGFILTAAFLLTLLGIIDITLIQQITLSVASEFFISLSINIINMYALCYFSINAKFKVITLCTLSVTLLSFISAVFIPLDFALISSTVIPFIFILIYLLKKKQSVQNLVFFLILTLAFQFIYKFIKFKIFHFNYYDLNSLSNILLSIDLFLYYIYMCKVVKNNVRLVGLVSKKFWVVPKSKHFQQDSQKDSELTNKQMLVRNIIMYSYFAFQIALLLLIGKIGSTLIEMICLLIMFFIGREILGNSWHSNSLKICFTVSTLSFYILSKVTLPLSLSLFTIIVASGTFIYLLHILGVKADRLDELENKELQSKLLNVENITIIMQETKVPQKYRDYLLQTIVNNMRDVEWFNLEVNRALNIDENQYRRYKTKFKKVLKSKGLL